MQKKNASFPFRFSIGTKLILITVLIETFTVASAIYYASSSLYARRLTQYQQILFSQSDLIAKEVTLEKDQAPRFAISKLELSPLLVFQIVNLDGRVVWDSKEPSRINAQILKDHTLFNLCRKIGVKRGSIDFTLPQTEEHYLGTYRRVLDQYLILGAISKSDVYHDVLETLEHFFFYANLVGGLSFILIVLFTRRIVGPIRQLTQAVREMGNGNFEVELKHDSSDEIGELSRSFNYMAKRMKSLVVGELKKNRIEKEVSLAAELQQHLLPPPTIQTARYDMESSYQSATETGGDYWGYIETPTHLLVYVGDATGHGIPSAMLTAAARGSFSALQHLYRNDPKIIPTPSQFLSFANEAVLDMSSGELQMTMFAAVYDFSAQTLSYSNAGHNPAWIIRKSERGPELEILLSRGPRLGESRDFQASEDHQTQLLPNDVIFLYSDGLIESKNREGHSLGKSKIKDLLLSTAVGNPPLSEMKAALQKRIQEHHAGDPPDDDITYSLVRFK